MLGDSIVPTDNSVISNTGFLFPAWSTLQRKPLFYSPKYIANYATGEDWGTGIDLAKMATGSASNGVYFNEFGKGELTFTNTTDGTKVDDLVTGAAAIAICSSVLPLHTCNARPVFVVLSSRASDTPRRILGVPLLATGAGQNGRGVIHLSIRAGGA